MVLELQNTEYEYKVKPGRYSLVMTIIMVILLMATTILGLDVFILFLIAIVAIIPLLILFRNSIINYLPSSLSNNLKEIDLKNKKTTQKNISNTVKQVGYFITTLVILIGASLLIFNLNKDINMDRLNTQSTFKPIHKFVAALTSILVAGAVVIEI